jgi:pimeloyl-ACP methyl ester carboxylesterase
VTGEAALDRVVPVSSSLEYLRLIPGARHVRLARTGHLGLITRPDAYAELLTRFALDTRP